MQKALITTILAGFVATFSIQLSYAASTPGIGMSSAGANVSASGLSNEAGSIAAGGE